MGKHHSSCLHLKYPQHKRPLDNYDIVHFELSIMIRHLSELKEIDDLFTDNCMFKLISKSVVDSLTSNNLLHTFQEHFVTNKTQLHQKEHYFIFYHFCGSSFYLPLCNVGYDKTMDDSFHTLNTLPSSLFKKQIRYFRNKTLDTRTLQNKHLNLFLSFQNNQIIIVMTPNTCSWLNIQALLDSKPNYDLKIFDFPSETNTELETLLVKTFSTEL
jgi:hypothetical protein